MRRYFAPTTALVCSLLATHSGVFAQDAPTLRQPAVGAARASTTQPTTRRASRHEPQRIGPPQPTRLRLDVYMLELTNEQALAFSLDSLKADTLNPTELLDELKKLGSASLKHRFDERLDLAAPFNLTSGQQVPVVTNMRIGAAGAPIPSVDYRAVGIIADIIGLWGPQGTAANTANIKIDLEMSHTATSAMKAVAGIQLPQFLKLAVVRELRVEHGRPVLSFAIQPRQAEGNEPRGYFATVIRLQLDRLQPGD
jgi:hypothetical protein